MNNQEDNFSRLFDEDYYRQLENEIKNHGQSGAPTPPINATKSTETFVNKDENTESSVNVKVNTKKRPTPKSSVYDEIFSSHENNRHHDIYQTFSIPKISEDMETQRPKQKIDFSKAEDYDVFNDGTKRKKSHKGLLITLIIVAVILLLAGGVFLCYQQGYLDAVFPKADTAQEETTATVSTEAPTEKPTENLLDNTYFITPEPKDNKAKGHFDNSSFIWNDKAFELFYGDDTLAKNYAKGINYCADKLGDNFTVYDMIVPTHVEMGLPSRLIEDGTVNSLSQSRNIGTAYKNMNDSVIPVNCYNYLANHCNEYIYYNTDHHWSGLGSYYAYQAFAEKLGLPALNLKDCDENTIEGFYGTLANNVSADLPADTVTFWTFPYDTSNTIYYNGPNKSGTPSTVYYMNGVGGPNTYGVFLWGDQPLEVLKSQSPKAKGKIALVKESFGNAFAPYLTYNYEEVHVVDFRYFDSNLKEYCEKNKIDTVIFMNGVMSANTPMQVDKIKGLFK